MPRFYVETHHYRIGQPDTEIDAALCAIGLGSLVFRDANGVILTAYAPGEWRRVVTTRIPDA